MEIWLCLMKPHHHQRDVMITHKMKIKMCKGGWLILITTRLYGWNVTSEIKGSAALRYNWYLLYTSPVLCLLKNDSHHVKTRTEGNKEGNIAAITNVCFLFSIATSLRMAGAAEDCADCVDCVDCTSSPRGFKLTSFHLPPCSCHFDLFTLSDASIKDMTHRWQGKLHSKSFRDWQNAWAGLQPLSMKIYFYW